MRTKLFEIRDRITFIPVIAVHLLPAGEGERYLLARCGFGTTIALQDQYVLLGRLGDCRLRVTPSDWPEQPRTMRAAHQYALDHWAELQTGDVIDVEFILGESTAPKQSERIDEIADAAADALPDSAFER